MSHAWKNQKVPVIQSFVKKNSEGRPLTRDKTIKMDLLVHVNVSELRPSSGLLFVAQMTWVWRATVEWYWQGTTEEFGEKPIPVPLFPHGLTCASAKTNLNKLVMTYQPDILNTVFYGGDEPLGLKKKGILYNNYQLFGEWRLLRGDTGSQQLTISGTALALQWR
jgi:hypothetical protein